MVKKKVLYVADTFLPKKDGVVRFIMETAKRLKDDFKISFLVPKFEGSEKAAKEKNLDVTFVPVRRFQINDYRIAHPKSKIIKDKIKSADFVFVQSAAPLGASSVKEAKKLKKKTILYLHSIDWELLVIATGRSRRYIRMLRPLVRRTHKRVDLIVAPTKRIAEKISTKKLRKKIKIVPEGIDKNKFSPDRTKRVLMRKELGLRGKFVIGYIGRLSREKNLDSVLQAFKYFKKKVKDSVLLFVGNGPLKKEFEKEKDLILTGSVENPQDYLQAMDVFVLLSETETSALSLMEAMACGLPVIASSVGAIPSYVKHKENGLLLSKKSIKPHLVSKLMYEIYSNPTLKNRLKKNAEKTFRDVYTWDKTAAELKNIFKEINE